MEAGRLATAVGNWVILVIWSGPPVQCSPPKIICLATAPCAGRLQYSEAEVQRLAVDLVEELTSLGHPGDAAHVAATYLADADNAVLLFAQSRQWREALRVAYQCVLPSCSHAMLDPVICLNQRTLSSSETKPLR